MEINFWTIIVINPDNNTPEMYIMFILQIKGNICLL